MRRNRGRRLAHPLPLPKGIVLCGELTLDPSQPHNNVLPFPDNISLDVRSTPIENVHTVQGTGLGADFGVQLMTFLTAQARALHLDHVDIKVPRGTKYLVRNSEPSFRRACGTEAVRDWLKEHVIDEGRKAAMIVGMYTYSNATYVRTHHNELSGRATVSTGTGTVNPTAAAAAIALDYQAFNCPEEQIFAIEYKEVKFKTWTKKKVADAKLEDGPNRWEVFFGDRSKGAEVDEKENIVEFNFDNGESEADENDDDDDMDDDLTDIADRDGSQGGALSLDFEGSTEIVDDDINLHEGLRTKET